MKILLDLRKKLKAKKPRFIRHDAHKKKRVSDPVWRKPRGRQNKMRLHKKGYARDRSTGYGSPTAVKFLSKEGLTRNLVYTQKDIDALNHTSDGLILARTLGAKKKLALIDYAQKNNFTVLDLRVDEFKKSVDDMLAKKSAKRKVLDKRKAKIASAKKDDSKDSKKKVKEESSESVEDKKIAEKKELDKLLTKGDTQ